MSTPTASPQGPPAAARGLLVQWWPIAKVRLYEQNPRLCGKAAIRAVAASIEQFGWKVPLAIAAQGTIVAGHTRYRAAQRLGAEQVPVIVTAMLRWQRFSGKTAARESVS
jgi:hypothetical protein